MREYASLAQSLHIIVFTKRAENFTKIDIAPNCIAYPTNSLSRWTYVFSAYFLARRFFLPATPSISLITTQDPFETGLAGFFIARMLHRPLHLQVHTDLFAKAFLQGSVLNRIRVTLAKLLFRSKADIRVVSNRIKTSIYREIKFPFNWSPRIKVLPVFIDAEKFITTPPSFDLHEQYPGFDLLMLMVARLEKEKNVLRAIRLVKDITKKKPGLLIGLVIVGSGSQEKMLQKYTARAGLSERVFFCGWQNDLVSYYKTADILLVTSQYEGYGRMFVEAAASGCPVVSVDVGVANEMLLSHNASICPDTDADCLERNIVNLASEHAVKEAFVASARGEVSRTKFPSKEEYLLEYQHMWEQAAQNEDFVARF
jgi:glycosyltransferase involved in cell wall biosynthesis